jgi:DNA-binding MarR family transcriptional regulator
MNDTSDNSRRFLHLLERMRSRLLGPAFVRLHELQLSPSHHRVLRAIIHSSPLAMKDLAEQLGLTPPSVTALTRRLVQTGLVARRPHAEDSRVVLLELTEAGKELHRELLDEQLRWAGEFLAALDPAEQQLFLDLLDRAVGEARPGADCRPPSA